MSGDTLYVTRNIIGPNGLWQLFLISSGHIFGGIASPKVILNTLTLDHNNITSKKIKVANMQNRHSIGQAPINCWFHTWTHPCGISIASRKVILHTLTLDSANKLRWDTHQTSSSISNTWCQLVLHFLSVESITTILHTYRSLCWRTSLSREK